MHATIIVTPKASVFDPQGEAVRGALEGLGLEEIQNVHVGKHIRLTLAAKPTAVLRRKLEEACRNFLSNPVIEDYELFLESSDGTGKAAPDKKHILFAAGEEMAGSLTETGPSPKTARAKAKSRPAARAKRPRK